MWKIVRTFGLEHHDLPTMLWNATTLLKFLTLDIDPRNKKPVGIISYILMVFWSGCYYYVYLVSMVWFVFVRCRETGDWTLAITIFSLGTVSEICNTKLLAMFANRKVLRKLIADYLACDARLVISVRYANNMKLMLREVKKRAIIVWNVFMWNGVAYVAIAVCRPGRHMMEEEFVFFGFKDMVQMKTTPYYEIVLTINIIAVFVTTYLPATISGFFIIISGYIEAQMLAYSQEMLYLWEDAVSHCNRNSGNTSIIRTSAGTIQLKDTYTILDRLSHTSAEYHDNNNSTFGNASNSNFCELQNTLNNFVRERIIFISKSHAINIDLLNQIETVFQSAIAIEFTILCIGLSAVFLGALEKTYIQLPYVLMSVYINCYIGQRVLDANKMFEEAVYDSHWEKFDVTNRKMILMMLRSSQNMRKLSAGGVATLSLECFMSVLRTTYSVYTTLRSTMK